MESAAPPPRFSRPRAVKCKLQHFALQFKHAMRGKLSCYSSGSMRRQNKQTELLWDASQPIESRHAERGREKLRRPDGRAPVPRVPALLRSHAPPAPLGAEQKAGANLLPLAGCACGRLGRRDDRRLRGAGPQAAPACCSGSPAPAEVAAAAMAAAVYSSPSAVDCPTAQAWSGPKHSMAGA